MKLTPKQQELLDAMRSGVLVHFMYGVGSRSSYYFRSDTMRVCTQQVHALRKARLIREREPFGRVWVPV